MRRAWPWVVAAALVLGLLGLWLFLRLRGKTADANRTMADVVDAWSEPRIDAALRELDDLKKQRDVEQAQIAAAEAEVERVRQELRDKYQALDLSPEEMATRLTALRI